MEYSEATQLKGGRMAEYIDRTALLEKLPDEPYKGVLRRVLMQAPVADVTPVVNGKWVFNEDWWEFRCTNCHKAIGNIKKYDYCPNCGAKMTLE